MMRRTPSRLPRSSLLVARKSTECESGTPLFLRSIIASIWAMATLFMSDRNDAPHPQPAPPLLAAGGQEEHRVRERHAALLEIDHRQHLGDGDALHVRSE